MDRDERVLALVGHGLQVAGDATVGLSELGVAEAAGYLLLHLAHAQVPFGSVVGEGDVRVFGEKEHGCFVFFETFPQVMGIGHVVYNAGFGDMTALAVVLCRDRQKFPLATGEDVAVASLQGIILARREPSALALGDPGAKLLRPAFHVLRSDVAVRLTDEGQLAQQVRATEPVAAVLIGEIGSPAVVHDHPAIFRDDANSGHRFQPAFLVDKLTCDIPCRADVDPMIVLLDADGGLIDMHRRLNEDPIGSRLFPVGQRQVSCRTYFKIVASEMARPIRVWIECCTRLREIIWAISRFSAYVSMPEPYGTGPEKASGNSLRVSFSQCGQDDLGVDVAYDLPEDDVDLGAPLVTLGPDGPQVLPASLAEADLEDRNGLDHAGIARVAWVAGLALGMGASASDRVLILLGLGGGLAGIRAGFAGVLLHEDRHQHREQHQQRPDQGAASGRDLSVTGKLPEAAFERLELLAQGLLFDARHESTPRRLLAGLHRHQPGEHRQALRRRHRRIAACPGLSPALDRLAVGVVAPSVADPMHPTGHEVEPQLLGTHPGLVHHPELQALPIGKRIIVQRRGIARENHLARQLLQQPQQRDVIGLLVVEAVAPPEAARRVQTGGVGVDELPALIVKVCQEPVRVGMHPLHLVGALEFLQRPPVRCLTRALLMARQRRTKSLRCQAFVHSSGGVQG